MISYEARVAISMTNPVERREYAKQKDIEAEVLQHWKKGKICGQCEHFTQLGGRGSGCNGVCHIVKKSNYTSPGENSCELFERVE